MKLYRHYLYCPDYSPDYHEVKISPRGWKDVEKRLFRHEVYHSVLWVDTLETRFVNYGHSDLDYGGYHFIKNAVFSLSPDVEIQYIIQKLNIYTRAYESFWSGVLDLSPVSGYLETQDFVSVKTIDTRKLANFLNFDETEFNVFDNYSVNDTEIVNNIATTITFPKIDIYLRCEGTGAFDHSYDDHVDDNLTINDITADYTNNENTDRIGVSVDNVYQNDLAYDSVLKLSATGESDIDVKVSGSLGAKWTINKEVILASFDSYDNEIETDSYFILEDYEEYGDVGDIDEYYIVQDGYDFNFSLQVNVPSGGYARLYERFDFDVLTPSALLTLRSHTYLSEMEYYEVTNGKNNSSVKCTLIKNALTKAIQKATNETTTSKALYFNVSAFANHILTNGNLIRGINTSALKVSIRDMFKSLFSMLPIGLWYNKTSDRFEINSISEYYKTTEFTFSPTGVKDLEITLSENYYWNAIKAGYQTAKVDEFQGANDYNCEYNYSSLFPIDKTHDLKNPYYGSSIDAEVLRRKGGTSDETDNDNNVYVFQSNGTILTQASGFTGFEGITQYYNPSYTPRKNIQNHNIWISAQFFNKSTGKTKFQNADKNKNIHNGSTYEFDDIARQSISTLLFYPYVYKFSWYITEDFKQELKNDPHKKLKFTDNEGNEYKGYVLSLKYQDFTNECEFELLMCNPYR